jgi:hypothetical protein|nr:MAG TPA: hypothetical protein [Crassvirales sp.]
MFLKRRLLIVCKDINHVLIKTQYRILFFYITIKEEYYLSSNSESIIKYILEDKKENGSLIKFKY